MNAAFALPAEMTIYSVGELATAWRVWLGRTPGDEPVPVDASAVAEIDGAGVQLLLSLAASLALQRRTLRLDHPARPLREACAALGATGLLGLTGAAGELR